jgi:signal transduction histidine kinase
LTQLSANFEADIEAISSIPIVPTILDVVCRTTGMGFAAIARVTEDKWIACSVKDDILFGLLPGGELQVETTICHEIRQSGEAVVIDHVDDDPNFCGHPTPAMYGFQSYISMPIIRRDGSFFGTLCAIDPRPAKLKNPETIGMFKLFSELISFHLNSIEQLQQAEAKLLEEQKTAELREQFIAILGHDLRNPLGAISTSAQLLVRIAPDERSVRIANIIQDASYRMKGLIENILDFARGRLGDGISLQYDPNLSLEASILQVIAEMQAVWPNRNIETEFRLTEQVNCDTKRIAQLLSNLLSNALTHGKKDSPVKVLTISADGEFKLSVINYGKKISTEAMKRLFHPFSRGEVNPGQEGLGLGLYIASEIAIAHGGNIDVTSTSEETCFTLIIPSNQL